MKLKSWVISGTYNQAISAQIGTIEVAVERRHGNNGNEAGKRRRGKPVKATIRNNGQWTAIVNAHVGSKNQNQRPKYRALVVFYDPNGDELWRGESAILPMN